MPKERLSLAIGQRGPKEGPRPYRRKTDSAHIFVGLYPRARHTGISYSTKCRLTKPLREGIGIAKDCVHVGTYDDEFVAAAAVDMFYLSLIVDRPWTAPLVMEYLNTLDYMPLDQAAALRALQPFYEDESIDDNMSGTDESIDYADDDLEAVVNGIQWEWDLELSTLDID